MKRKWLDRDDGDFGSDLASGDEGDWPAVVRRLALKAQPRPAAEARRARPGSRIDAAERVQRIARVKPQDSQR